MKKLGICVAAITGFVGTSAFAADMAVKAPPAPAPAPVYNWTGCYLGGHGGVAVAHGSQNVQFDDVGAGGPELVTGGNPSPSGGVFGAQGGCNYQTGTIVVGIEGDYSWSNFSETQSAVVADGDDPPNSFNTKLEGLASVRGRIGMTGLLADRLLPYVTGGAAWARFHYSYFLNDVDTGINAGSLSFTATGAVVGGGVEWAMTNQIILRMEYLHYFFDHSAALPVVAGIGPGPGDYVKLNSADVFRVGASYKFW